MSAAGSDRQVGPQHQQREARRDQVREVAAFERLLGHHLARQRAAGQRIAVSIAIRSTAANRHSARPASGAG
jgi:hypothetical protein